jgi:hypothetical protein
MYEFIEEIILYVLEYQSAQWFESFPGYCQNTRTRRYMRIQRTLLQCFFSHFSGLRPIELKLCFCKYFCSGYVLKP